MKIQVEDSMDVELIKKQPMACIKGQKSSVACMNENCQKYAFMCDDQYCPCQNQHRECLYIKSKELITKFSRKIVHAKELENVIKDQIAEAISYLQKFRDKLVFEVRQQFTYSGLTNQEIQMAKALDKHQYKNIKGKDIWSIIHTLKSQHQSIDQILIYRKKIYQIFRQHEDRWKKNYEYSFENLKLAKEQMQAKFNKNQQNSQLFKNSQIIKNQLNIQNIKKFFDTCQIRSSKMLYKASQNNFQISKFHQKCDNITHTITLCQTQYDQVIGGYTPILWNADQNDQFKKDPQKRSFIFSLTNNEKLGIVADYKSDMQIFCSKHCGPTFGQGSDFGIMDRANSLKSSHARIGYTYFHKNYPCDDQKAWERFSGVKDSYYFKVKQWQVWQLQLSQI